ncbi:DUF4199 domain-containing protein [Mucilaginibacter sp. UR6-1]|uniref:DUF4199 domain-containing protein n=1 Tax=Mucilaginibacter sp. UR6-1 TaxID=1435643 RepID=UPI001E4C180A|nr:DUF4199 domain-containing protein [Mucilaginibacter sp. UR6-1]MCC8409032.1 DUF4199 domain-containing protein [Mucilaginibacter sp. UR6-1]
MKKYVITFGIIAGIIVSAMMVYSATSCYNTLDFEGSEVVGYSSMIIAFSFIFVAIKNYRDKNNAGIISFGKAFRVGLFITLVASTIYVLVWLIYFYNFMPDFMDKYTAHVLQQAKESGLSAAELKEQTAQMDSMSEMYKNPVFVVLFTYMEIMPVGLIISLIAALILKRRTAKVVAV